MKLLKVSFLKSHILGFQERANNCKLTRQQNPSNVEYPIANQVFFKKMDTSREATDLGIGFVFFRSPSAFGACGRSKTPTSYGPSPRRSL